MMQKITKLIFSLIGLLICISSCNKRISKTDRISTVKEDDYLQFSNKSDLLKWGNDKYGTNHSEEFLINGVPHIVYYGYLGFGKVKTFIYIYSLKEINNEKYWQFQLKKYSESLSVIASQDHDSSQIIFTNELKEVILKYPPFADVYHKRNRLACR